MAEENQENQKTIVSFVVGLLIGGILVWAFSGPADNAGKDTEKMSDEESAMETKEVDESMDGEEMAVKTLSVGEGEIVINDQPASQSIVMEKAVYPVSEGWIGVREYTNEDLGFILGVNRFSESQGLVPENIELIRSTTPGKDYAIVIFTEDGDFDFSLAGDVQIDTIFDTFKAE